MNIVFDVPENKAALWIEELNNYLPLAAINYYSDLSMETADYFICENPPANHLNKTFNIKAVFLLSAGFDYYSKLKSRLECKLLNELPCYRLEDAGMSEQMMDYASYSTLKFFRRFNEYDHHKTWKSLTPFSKADFKVGIMGTGELGSNVALRLNSLGFSINTWNRSEKNLINVTQFIGVSEFEDFIKNTHLLINLLPLNNQTKEILNKAIFEKLAKPSYFINLARGAHVVEADLVEALSSGVLSGAQLDVTVTEPLPDDSPLFAQQNCFITPHVAAKTLIKESCEQISKKIKLLDLDQTITGIIKWDEQN
jgi:glyoxylate/hydroxypyruvate reductase A